ncbi:uracil phosphoribosyltransferase [Candidatus Gottesmanbacteria bacterium RIFCSPLOWO2_01_FULL_43_11b]|uniref:Uracil phosphoribosyltransferase n=1 Tax=Candidatus Gottesmanbacteria bacterium RIFCSPLOWO2_01_FULL_43_11b TaxID=1798392 RepID=A0A1F6AIS8_9BACT|nr:MAG: uracil phosphoribosyltransferase [Candidatus Gottesmanbacteria bacterium RIFCSPLOWO2_01_FULL_43_11b]
MKTEGVTVVDHPLLVHSLTILRKKETGTEEFRRHAGIVSKMLILEATKQLTLEDEHIETPLAPFEGKRLADDVVVVPVLRAGLAMLFALQDFLPSVRVGFVGLERDEETAIAREYYQKLPKIFASHKVLVIDPMLATGGSFDDTLNLLKAKGAKHMVVICIVAAPEGIERVRKHHPEVPIITAAVDEKLNDKAYIVPGLGDFGDRYFGTEL